jgi:predicted PurR-regulated permease PerM
VKLTQMERLSVLACATGLALLAMFFAAAWLEAPEPGWLPMLIAAIAGFEIFMVFDALRKRRAGGGSNG